MKLKGSFEIVSFNDEYMLIPVGDETMNLHGVIRLNNSGAEILEMLKDDISFEEIILKLKEKYDNSTEELTTYVHDVVKEFKDKDLLL